MCEYKIEKNPYTSFWKTYMMLKLNPPDGWDKRPCRWWGPHSIYFMMITHDTNNICIQIWNYFGNPYSLTARFAYRDVTNPPQRNADTSLRFRWYLNCWSMVKVKLEGASLLFWNYTYVHAISFKDCSIWAERSRYENKLGSSWVWSTVKESLPDKVLLARVAYGGKPWKIIENQTSCTVGRQSTRIAILMKYRIIEGIKTRLIHHIKILKKTNTKICQKCLFWEYCCWKPVLNESYRCNCTCLQKHPVVGVGLNKWATRTLESWPGNFVGKLQHSGSTDRY